MTEPHPKLEAVARALHARERWHLSNAWDETKPVIKMYYYYVARGMIEALLDPSLDMITDPPECSTLDAQALTEAYDAMLRKVLEELRVGETADD